MTLRKKYLMFSLILLLLLSFLLINSYRNTLRFSATSGFYDSDFELTISGNSRHQIYYTLDGSIPTTDSIPYTGPISISDASKNPNQHSLRSDISTGFFTDLIGTYSQNPPGYNVPDYLVDKCTVVRAAAFSDGKQVATCTASYFIGFQHKPAYDSIPVVSLISDPANLFDSETGIYVLGNRWKDYQPELTNPDSWSRNYWWWWGANYRTSGKDSERIAYIEVFGADRQPILRSDCGIRIQGGGSRGKLPRSIGVYARTEYGGSEVFNADFWNNKTQPHKFVLFSGGDDNDFKLKDYMVNSLAKDLDFATMAFTPCVLFLDGEFWGTYYITESYNSNYVHDHYGISESNVLMIKNGDVTEGESHEEEIYESARTAISRKDMTAEEDYKNALRLIDLDSYLDYYASQIYIARDTDWPGGNWAAWRSRRTSQNNEYQDGRWRWMLFDVNSGCISSELTDVDTLAQVLAVDTRFKSLCKNEDFKQAFAQRLRFMAEEIYAPARCDAFIDQYLKTMLEPLAASAKRFHGDDMRSEIIANAEEVRTFFHERGQYVDKMIAANFGEGY